MLKNIIRRLGNLLTYDAQEGLKTPYQPFLMIYTAIGMNFLLKEKKADQRHKY